VHFTAGHTTEIVTAHAVAEVLAVALEDRTAVLSLQVELDGEFDDLQGVIAVPVHFGRQGWREVAVPELAQDELALLRRAVEQISIANSSVLTDR
jgi:malate dehydrogenase